MSAAGKGGMPSGPQVGGGPAPAQPAQQPDIYSRYGGQQNVDSDPNLDGYQPPTGSPMPPPAQVAPTPGPGMGGGKSGPGGKGGFPMGPQIGGGPAPIQQEGFNPTAPNPLGPEGQQPVAPQPPMGMPGTPGGKSQDQMDFARWNAGNPQTAELLTPESAKAKNDRQYAHWVEMGKPQASNGGKSGPGGISDMRAVVTPEMMQRQIQPTAFSGAIFGTPGSSNQPIDPNRVLL